MEIKGTALLAIRDFVKLNHQDKYEQWLGMLNEGSKQIFQSSIDSTKWYPVEIAAIEPTQRISELFFNNDIVKGAWESGRYSAQKGLTGIYKIFVKATSPSFIISRAKDVFARYYRPCEMEVVKNQDAGVLINLINADGCDNVIVNRICGWIERALEISGVKDIRITTLEKKNEKGNIIEFKILWS